MGGAELGVVWAAGKCGGRAAGGWLALASTAGQGGRKGEVSCQCSAGPLQG